MRKRLSPDSVRRARELREKQTDAESLLWWKLRDLNRRGFHFRRQVPFRGYFLDFVEYGARIVIEVDGSQHGFAQQRAHDDVRDSVLRREGYSILRFANVEVLKELERVVDVITREIALRPAPDTFAVAQVSTSPRGGGD